MNLFLSVSGPCLNAQSDTPFYSVLLTAVQKIKIDAVPAQRLW